MCFSFERDFLTKDRLTKYVGYRAPGTREGSQNGAYVVRTFIGLPLVAGYFDNYMMHVDYPTVWEYMRIKRNLIASDWRRMTPRDIRLTVGIRG